MIYVHRFVLSVLFSIINWTIIDTFLIKMPLWKYFIIEISVLIMVKLLIFTYQKFGLEEKDGDETNTH